MTGTDMLIRDLPALAKTFEKALIEASQDRKARPEFVTDPDTGKPECAWVLHERGVMLTEANTVRDRHGWPHLTSADMLRAETSACGHIDYTFKYGLGVARAALTPPDPE